MLWMPVAVVFGSSGSGGVAALNHRLTAGIPPGCDPHAIRFDARSGLKNFQPGTARWNHARLPRASIQFLQRGQAGRPQVDRVLVDV